MYVYVNIFVEVFVFHCLCATIVRWARNFYFMSVNELLLFVFDVIAVVGRWWFFFLISFLFFQLIHVLFHAHSEPFCFNTSNAKYPHNFNACTTKIAHIWFVVLQFRLYGYSSSMFAWHSNFNDQCCLSKWKANAFPIIQRENCIYTYIALHW